MRCPLKYDSWGSVRPWQQLSESLLWMYVALSMALSVNTANRPSWRLAEGMETERMSIIHGERRANFQSTGRSHFKSSVKSEPVVPQWKKKNLANYLVLSRDKSKNLEATSWSSCLMGDPMEIISPQISCFKGLISCLLTFIHVMLKLQSACWNTQRLPHSYSLGA